MITFTIKYNETENKADMKDTDSMLDLKNLIIENLKLDTQYIDLDEKPMRRQHSCLNQTYLVSSIIFD